MAFLMVSAISLPSLSAIVTVAVNVTEGAIPIKVIVKSSGVSAACGKRKSNKGKTIPEIKRLSVDVKDLADFHTLPLAKECSKGVPIVDL